VLFELANADRLSVLQWLKQNQKGTLSGISRELGIVVQEVHRNVNRLVEADLVKKESANYYSLTTFGSTLLVNLDSVKFFADNKEFFTTRALGNLTDAFVQRIGTLAGAKLVDNSVGVYEYQRNLIESSEKYSEVMLSHVPSYLIEKAEPLVKRGTRIRYLLPVNAVLPKKRHSDALHSAFYQAPKSGVIMRRMAPQIDVGIIISEKEAMICFPRSGQAEPDTNAAFCSAEGRFHGWCRDYFNQIRGISRSFDSKLLVEV
jgi:predicted transcriptional regulator